MSAWVNSDDEENGDGDDTVQLATDVPPELKSNVFESAQDEEEEAAASSRFKLYCDVMRSAKQRLGVTETYDTLNLIELQWRQNVLYGIHLQKCSTISELKRKHAQPRRVYNMLLDKFSVRSLAKKYELALQLFCVASVSWYTRSNKNITQCARKKYKTLRPVGSVPNIPYKLDLTKSRITLSSVLTMVWLL